MTEDFRRILVQPLWKPTASVLDSVSHPPSGYKLELRQDLMQGMTRLASRFDLSYRILAQMYRFFPVSLWRASWNSREPVPQGIYLVYSFVGLWMRNEPWVLDIQADRPYALVGSVSQLMRQKERVRAILRSPACRGIVSALQAGKQTLLGFLDGDEIIAEKTFVIPWAVPSQPPIARTEDGKLRLLFVTSANVNAESNFALKGGREVVAAFTCLRQRYGNLELILRCQLPDRWRRRVTGVEGIKLHERNLPREEFVKIWRSANIFVQPGGQTTTAAYLEAMSYGLPVVTSDVWGNCEIVEDGKTGFLVHKPEESIDSDDWVARYTNRELRRDTDSVDSTVVEQLVDRLTFLIENPEARSRMSVVARQEIQEGKHSFSQRNRVLKELFDRPLQLPSET